VVIVAVKFVFMFSSLWREWFARELLLRPTETANRGILSARPVWDYVHRPLLPKLRYGGLKKNAHRLFVTCALVNLLNATA
jgi:hypothetical protein